MPLLNGMLLVPTAKNPDTGLWFIFHHEPEGVLAFDLTREHADIPARHFRPLFATPQDNPDQPVLHGGPKQPDSAMLVLHNHPAAGPDAHIVNDGFAFHSFRYVPVAGKPPAITKADDSPARLALPADALYHIIMGFRLWEMPALEEDLKNWQWTLLPATPDIVFHTPMTERLNRARRSIN